MDLVCYHTLQTFTHPQDHFICLGDTSQFDQYEEEQRNQTNRFQSFHFITTISFLLVQIESEDRYKKQFQHF